MNTKHIIATGTGNIGIAALIAELFTIKVGSTFLPLEAIFDWERTFNRAYRKFEYWSSLIKQAEPIQWFTYKLKIYEIITFLFPNLKSSIAKVFNFNSKCWMNSFNGTNFTCLFACRFLPLNAKCWRKKECLGILKNQQGLVRAMKLINPQHQLLFLFNGCMTQFCQPRSSLPLSFTTIFALHRDDFSLG